MNPQTPLVSVIIPVFNSAAYIADSINSILRQDYTQLEIIVVDDGSTDGTAEIVQGLADPRVRYVCQSNSGSAVARNYGISLAKGELIAFNDSDDLWAPQRLTQQVNYLNDHPEYQAVCGRFMHVNADFSLTAADATAAEQYCAEAVFDPTKSGWMYLTLLQVSCFHIITLLVKKQALAQVHFNPDYRRGQDYDFWLQLANQTRVAQLDNLYAFYRKNLLSISHKPHSRNYRAEILQAAISQYGTTDQLGRTMDSRQLNTIFAQVWFEHGYELFQAKWYKASAQSYRRGLRYRKNKAGAYKFLLLSYLLRLQDRTPAYAVTR
ncbi:glycosyltransferase family 2 protein [Rheinheimera sp. YQF-2]|uniref:Glycosyltransferase family 2 protein n=1 Tax=Rheinheimera lutimaris TaxID=2740584 RepID=A0A7Y5APT2_9GAMM|nr:glycosyltransferase family 2 protein [Rheinheimera lutimaris]NRQ42019.1 glycosyltransferase family 2 protein [Rheinheimera lutimaris]